MLKFLEKKLLKPATLLAPVPVVLVSCRGTQEGAAEKPNLITLAWAGTICSEPPMVSISIRKSRYSHQKILESGEFVINLVNEELLWAADLCGVKSGRDIDKFAVCKLTPVAASGLAIAPAVAESPLTLSCKVYQVIELGSHDCFLASVTAVEAASKLIDKQDRLRLDRANLVAYAHGEYRTLGELAGFYGYSVASQQVLARRLRKKNTPNQSLRRPVKKSGTQKTK